MDYRYKLQEYQHKQRQLAIKEGLMHRGSIDAGNAAALMFLFCALICLCVTVFYISRMHEVMDASRWSATTGKFVASRLLYASHSRGGGWFYTEYEYRYAINGKTYVYVGERIQLGVAPGHETTRPKIEEGGNVVVYYNPSKPDQSALIVDQSILPSIREGIISFSFSSVIFVLLALFCYKRPIHA